jgi:hypothetical protein
MVDPWLTLGRFMWTDADDIRIISPEEASDGA